MSLFFHPLSTLIYSAIFVSVDSKVCTSLDVRNTPDHISFFRDCRIIDGYLHVVLIETANDFSDYSYNNTFAELVEIRDYLMVYRVMNLTSLGLIFPKLTKIGGKDLFRGHSLVLHELFDLEEIGLVNLEVIGNGSVRVGGCPHVCYVETVNWAEIGASGLAYNKNSTCEEICPVHCKGSCWNDIQCQNSIKSKCHPLCVGCTQPDSPKHCILCKYFNDGGTCVQACPDSKITDNKASKCVSVQECVFKPGRFGNWSIFKECCIEECPFWFARASNGSCTPSQVNICQGIKITNHILLEEITYCTHIHGGVEIALDEYVDMVALERSLKLIVSISDYLKISRSPSIVSLSIFNNLTVIKGEKLWSQNYALFVDQNSNLQKLFSENVTRNLVIERGEAIFQKNPYLCESEIDRINVTSNYSNSNGEQAVCNLTQMNVTILENNPTNVTLWWLVSNKSHVYGYTVYYMRGETNEKYLNLKNICVNKELPLLDDIWNSVSNHSTSRHNTSVLLKRLKPDTVYSYFITTTSYFNKSKHQEETPIYHFRTAMDVPTEPMELMAESYSDTTINLTWNPPIFINGNLSYYHLTVYVEVEYSNLLSQRNYCTSPYNPSKESNCSCSESGDVQLFYFGGTCIGPGDHYCNTQTVYDTVTPSETRVQKRSISNIYERRIKEINITETSFVVRDLDPFTSYSFFLKACNSKEGSESDHCGGAEMVVQRTQKTKGADDVTHVKVKVNDRNVSVTWVKPAKPNPRLLVYNVEYKELTSAPTTICRRSNEEPEVEILDLTPGKYSARVRAVSLAGPGEASRWVSFEIKSDKVPEVPTTDWSLGFWIFFAMLIGILLVYVIWRRYKLAKSMDMQELLLKMSAQRSRFEAEDEWKLDDETVEIIKELEQNSIGILYRKQD